MGAFYQRIEIAARYEGPFEAIEALVDTGSTYTWVPRPMLENLGVRAVERGEFETADGRVLELEMAEVPVRLDGRVHYTVVVFGNLGTTPLLGVVTLETFGLGVDPVRQRLIPVRGLAMASLLTDNPSIREVILFPQMRRME